MSGSKHFDHIAVIITALTLVVTVLFMNGAALGIETAAHTIGYENRLFDNSKVHTIDIVMNDWDSFIKNATSEEYYTANAVIDGESYKNIGIRAKGNTSLSTVSSLGSERYSFKIEFDHYDKTKSYHGLDKLSLNNLIQDSTMMKDYLTYTLMNNFGVDSSLCSYVYITVNGEDWGLYLAVEGVEESFLERNYGSDYGELYKPDSMSFGGGRGNGKDFDMDKFDFGNQSTDSSDKNSSANGFDPSSIPNVPNMPSMDNSENADKFDFSNIPDDFDPSAIMGGGNEKGGFGGGGMGSSDVKLQYIDDELDSYSNIWDNAKTDITQADQKRLIESLKKLSNNEDIASVVDVEQVIRYFVVHNYVCNGDSYTGSMIHNYYLYEKDGQLAMLPWDYNLAFGTFQGGNANSTVNTPVDSPVDNGSGEDRPMWNWIVSNEEYTELYHKYFSEFLKNTDIDGTIESAYNLIKEYVEKDPTAFYSTDEFELGVETLRKFCSLRSESISKQLENGETVNNMNYVDASSVTLSDMGSMGGGMGMHGNNKSDNQPSKQNSTDSFNAMKLPDNGQSFDSVSKLSDDAKVTFTLSVPSKSTDTNTPPNMPNMSDMPSMPEGAEPPDMPNGAVPGQAPDNQGNGNMPDIPNMPSESQSAPQTSENTTEQQTSESNTEQQTNESTSESKAESTTDRGTQKPSGDFSFGRNDTTSSANNMKAWVLLVVSIVILGIGLIVAKKYKA